MNIEKRRRIMCRMISRTTVVIAVAFFLLGVATPGFAKTLLEERFDNSGPGQVQGGEIVPLPGGGQGWRGPGGDDDAVEGYVEYDLQDLGLDPSQGTIEFEVERNEIATPEAMFTFVDDNSDRRFGFRIYWRGPRGEYYPRVGFHGASGGNFWYRMVEKDGMSERENTVTFGRPVGKGQTVHIAMSWGGPGGNYIAVDGKKLDALYDEPFSLPERIATSSRLLVGAETSSENPGGAWSMSHSLISDFRVHDVALSPNELSQPIEVSGEALISWVDHDASRVAGFSGKLVAGDTVAVTMEGTSGAEASFDVARLADFRGEIAIQWQGWGVYLEKKTFFDDGEIDLRDVNEYRVYLDTEPIDTGAITEETVFVEALEVEEQSYNFDRLEPDTPYYVSVVAVMDDGTFLPVISDPSGIAMQEVEGYPGAYQGTFTVDYEDRYPEAVVVGHLGSGAVLANDEYLEIDPSLNIEVVASPEELKADEKSTSEVTVTVTDANGDDVPDHEVRFVLATTSKYTGVVGGGAFSEEVGGALEEDFRGETDLFGKATATYTAGFAAKTAIIVARDMQSNDTGVGYVKTYINATAQLELEAVQQTAGKALGYTITVTSSDEWLTADGKSEARITAFVAQDGIPVEGHRVGFTVAGGSGKIRTVRGETDSSGKARAVYTAGTKIGIVLIRATDHSGGISGTVQIELRSDAPAKIAVTVEPEVLPADGRSTADVAVTVTDINDNPNEDVEVEYAVSIGSGRLRSIEEVTDRRGESSAEYVAGTIPGRVSIEVTVRSAVPTDEELAEARALATAVTDYDFF